MNDDEKVYLYDRAQMLKRQRDTAEEERDGWKIRAMKAEQERQAARAECEALRKDAERLDWLESRHIYSVSNLGGVSCVRLYASSGNEVSVIVSLIRPTLREALTAALAVQPTKLRLPFIAHEKCHDFNSCARNQRCMYGKIGASGKWDNCFTAGAAHE